VWRSIANVAAGLPPSQATASGYPVEPGDDEEDVRIRQLVPDMEPSGDLAALHVEIIKANPVRNATGQEHSNNS
jgi:hypothetical protein